MNDDVKAELVQRMLAIGFKPAPKSGMETFSDDDYVNREVTVHTEDGVFFRLCDGPNYKGHRRDVQLLIVGPMAHAPGWYADIINRGYWLKATSFLGGDYLSPEMRQLLINRGFISLMLRHLNDEAPAGMAPTRPKHAAA